jgi:NAD(P)-dependent dehydrogenase (short-subunit alcohol dehydrogenase family)
MTPPDHPQTVLITGCSSGIGRATAERLARAGWTVYATARRPESIADLEAAGCKLLALDVTDSESMASAVKEVEAAGGLDALVNNAGYGLHGAIETTSLEDARKQFDTNFFGLVELTQMVLPGMRERCNGRIVNMSSMGGKLTFPGGGFYHASKHALEAFSDALRFELAGFGINVVVIEPGLIKTEFGKAAIDTIDNESGAGSPYDHFNQTVMQKINAVYEGAMSRMAASPDAVAKVVEKALTTRRPNARYRVTAGARALIAARRFLPDRVFDAMLRRQYPSPRP